MIGILIAVIISWIILYLDKKDSILALGFLPITKRLKQFSITFLVSAFLCVIVLYLEYTLSSATCVINSNMDIGQVLQMFWWDAKSVLTEELIFRGALLLIFMRRIGEMKAIIISAIAFGIYHWFSFGIIGNIIPMVIVFIGTGLMGYAWALAFSKTKSLLVPIGFHLGWNFTFNTIFSRGPLGEGVLKFQGGQSISDWFSLVGLWVVPLVMLGVVIYFVPKENAKPSFIQNV